MTLKDRINEDLKNAMKTKDALLTETLRSIRAEILKMDKSGLGREINEEEEIQILSRLAKMRKESIEAFEKAGRTDLAEKEKMELAIIQKYLPEQISTEEASQIIDKILQQLNATTQKDFGRAMGAVMKELKGKIDGKIVQELVKSKLTN